VPVSKVTIARYVAHLAHTLKYQTITQYINVIRLLHLEYGFPNPLHDNWLLTSLLKGVARAKGTAVNKKLPITPEMLLLLRQTLDFTTVNDVVFWAAALTMFFTLFRKSNVFPPSIAKFDANKHLCRKDFSVLPDNTGLLISIKWSKTIQLQDRSLITPLPLLKSHPLCPTSAVIHAFRLTKSVQADSPAFWWYGSNNHLTPMLCQSFITKLKLHLSKCHIDTTHISSHSFRRGGSSHALMQGIPTELIQLMGDWKSDAYKNYLSIPLSTKLQALSLFTKNLPSTLQPTPLHLV